MEKLHIEKNSIQETLIIPLYARKLCTEIYPELFQDEKSSKLIQNLDYDFSQLEKQSNSFLGKFGALEIAMRQIDIGMEIKQYLQDHPKAAVINLGCGLDQTAETCDNGQCKIYNLDMPDVIQVRNQMIPPQARTKNIGCDLNDLSWFDQIDASQGSIFFASGVFYYFTTDQMQKLINSMAIHFPKGRLVFDSVGKIGLKIMLKTYVKQAGIQNISAFFHVDSLKQDILPWIKNSTVYEKGYMLGYVDLSSQPLPRSFRWLARIGDEKIHMKIIRIDLNGESE